MVAAVFSFRPAEEYRARTVRFEAMECPPSKQSTPGTRLNCLHTSRRAHLASQAGLSRCLDAFIVALNQPGDTNTRWNIKPWYTSTKELQLASLEFCAACRSVPRLDVTVTKRTPTRLWMGAPTRATRSTKRLSSTRVPVVRASRVIRERSASDLRNMGDVLSKAKLFIFDSEFNGDVRGVVWPASIESLGFSKAFKLPLQGLPWPESLQTLIFEGGVANLAGAAWPSSLRTLLFGCMPNESVAGVTWPVLLKELDFQTGFNQPIDTVAWPPSLEALNLGFDFNQPINDVKWPPSLTKLRLAGVFNQEIDMVAWPGLLEDIEFGWRFNQPLGGVQWPASLQQLYLRSNFQHLAVDIS